MDLYLVFCETFLTQKQRHGKGYPCDNEATWSERHQQNKTRGPEKAES